MKSVEGVWDWYCSNQGPWLLPFDEEARPIHGLKSHQRRRPQRKHREYTPTVTASGQKWCVPSSLTLLVRTNHVDLRGLENIKLSFQEGEIGFESIKPVFCHICYLTLLVLLTLSNQPIFYVSVISSEQGILSYFLSQSVPSFCLLQGSLAWNSIAPTVYVWTSGPMHSPNICSCVHFPAERTNST